MKNHKKAPKSAPERHKGRGTQPFPALGAVLSRSWGALGVPRTRPRPSKAQPRAPKLEPNKAIFCVFFCIFFSRRFSYRFVYPKNRNDLYRNLKNINFASTGARFSRNRRFQHISKKTLILAPFREAKTVKNRENRVRKLVFFGTSNLKPCF